MLGVDRSARIINKQLQYCHFTYDFVSHFRGEAPKATLVQRAHDLHGNTINSHILTIFYVPGSLSLHCLI